MSNIAGTSNGIAIHVHNSPNVEIQRNQFTSNAFPSLIGTEEAAGVYVGQTAQNAILDSNSFIQCRAASGGAISFKNAFAHFSNNYFADNEGSVYGRDLAAFPVAL